MAAPERIPVSVRDVLLDLAGAHANHQFFWKIIGPGGPGAPRDALAAAIDRDFGGFAAMQAAFATSASALKEPRFVFLSLTRPKAPKLEIVALPLNGSVLALDKPGVLVCDLWPHAWQADHPTLLGWVEAFWTIVNWHACGARYDALIKGERPV